MAFIFGDSFSHYNIGEIAAKWSATGAGATYSIDSSTVVRPGSCSLYMVAGGATGSTSYVSKTLSSTYETFVAGCYFQPTALGARGIMQFLDTGTEHVSVRYNVSGNITLTRNGTVLATSANTMSAGTWYHVEVKVTIGDAADTPSGRYQVKVDGVDWIADSGTGQDTRNGGNKSINEVRLFVVSNSASGYWSDFYLLDTTGSVANNFLGPVRFAVLRPAGVGNSAQFTGNYADNFVNVQDRNGDGDATFNQSSTAGHIDLFSMGDPPSGTIYAVQHVLMAKRDAGGARTIRPKTRISSTNYNGTSISVGTSYTFHTDPTTLSPATSAQWTDTEIAGAEFGYELVS